MQVEVNALVRNYIERHTEAQVARFMDHVRKGDVEICGFYLNMPTEVTGHEEMIRCLYYAQELRRKYGVRIDSAMIHDVPGYAWSLLTSGALKRMVKDGDITGLTSDRISQKGIARSYQITNILPNATALENVRIAAQSRRHSWSLLTHHRSYRDILEKAEAALQAVGLRDKADELAANLSHGEQRNLEIGIALATEPQLLCLDEPTAGMSAAETHDTMELVRRISKNLTIMIVEHDMQVVMELAHRITVLHYGEVLAEGTPGQIQGNPKVMEVYLKT